MLLDYSAAAPNTSNHYTFIMIGTRLVFLHLEIATLQAHACSNDTDLTILMIDRWLGAAPGASLGFYRGSFSRCRYNGSNSASARSRSISNNSIVRPVQETNPARLSCWRTRLTCTRESPSASPSSD